jgi:hypothetical protein
MKKRMDTILKRREPKINGQLMKNSFTGKADFKDEPKKKKLDKTYDLQELLDMMNE